MPSTLELLNRRQPIWLLLAPEKRQTVFDNKRIIASEKTRCLHCIYCCCCCCWEKIIVDVFNVVVTVIAVVVVVVDIVSNSVDGNIGRDYQSVLTIRFTVDPSYWRIRAPSLVNSIVGLDRPWTLSDQFFTRRIMGNGMNKVRQYFYQKFYTLDF